MKPKGLCCILLLLMVIGSVTTLAQQVNSLYFIENAPMRHYLNPAFRPNNQFYISLPVAGYTMMNIGNNSLSIKDVLYNKNGETISFLHPEGDVDKFYNTLKPVTNIHSEMETNLLGIGLKHNSNFWSFSLTEKAEAELAIPKDFFKISLYGTPEAGNNSFDFAGLQSQINVYSEAALGVSRAINPQWTGGIRLKFLYGSANTGNTNKSLALNANSQQLKLDGAGLIHYAGPVELSGDFRQITYPNGNSAWLKPSGVGGGVDLGVEYKPTENLSLSAALTDLGFIVWNGNVRNTRYEVNYTFDGIKQINNNTDLTSFLKTIDKLVSGNELVDSLTKAFQNAVVLTPAGTNYTTATTAKLNIGAEYSLLENRLGLGLLSRTIFFTHSVNQEITASINARPAEWLNASVCYSMISGGSGSIGLALGVRTGFIHWFLATDYVPFNKTTLSLKEIKPDYPNIHIPFPYNSKNYNISLGLNLVFKGSKGNKK